MKMYTYKAKKSDFQAIEKGIETSLSPKLSYIFSNKNFLNKMLIISYDSRFIYIWTKDHLMGIEQIDCNLSNFNAYKIPSSIYFSENERLGWSTGGLPSFMERLLSVTYRKYDPYLFKIHGSLMGDCINVQRKLKGVENNPYITQESYMATIIHELGHVYFGCFGGKYWNNDKTNNLKILDIALQLYASKSANLNKSVIRIPGYQSLSELFAFCTDYSVASIFWHNHQRDLDTYYERKLRQLLTLESANDLNSTNSVLDDPHNFACVMGKILLSRYPKTWPNITLKKSISTF